MMSGIMGSINSRAFSFPLSVVSVLTWILRWDIGWNNWIDRWRLLFLSRER